MSDSKSPAVVIENGSWTIKAGLAGDDGPRTTFPTLAGTRQNTEELDIAVGQQVKDNFDDMCAHWTFDKNSCSDWDDMTLLWKHAYSAMNVEPSSTNVLTTVSVTTPKQEREKMIEIFFEKFNVPGCYIAYDSVLSMYATGRMSGLAVDCGHGATNLIPMFEGFAIHDQKSIMPFGGKAATDFLASLIAAKGIDLSTPTVKLFEVTKIKESLCRAALDYGEEMKSAATQKYTLPDGKTVELDTELLTCAEGYFQPSVRGPENDSKGLPKLINDAIAACDMDIRSALMKNIILSGGSSMFPGFSERLTKEMKALNQNAKVIATAKRNDCTFIGGSVLAALPAMENQWVTKADFAENGAKIVNTKCA